MRAASVSAICLLVLLFCLLPVKLSKSVVRAASTCPVHNLNTGLDYATIQGAIDASETTDGHVIQVDPGTYYEHIVVYKTISLVGENKHTTVIDGNESGTVVTIAADNSSMANFTIKGGGALHNAGIFLDGVCNSLIESNVIEENRGDALYLSGANGNLIRENTIIKNEYGIFATFSLYNNITENFVANNEVAISLIWSSENNVAKNIITNNVIGINAFYRCRENKISENLIENNTIGMKFADGCSENRIYHNNFVSNLEQAMIFDPEDPIYVGVEPSANTWDGGYPSGGNYWSNNANADFYSGPYQNESGIDIICDTPFTIADDNRDNYPLAHRWRIIKVPLEYPTIQAAINAADPGDTVFVLNGTYYEHLIINKSLCLIGQDKYTTIVDGSDTGSVVKVTANRVTLIGFTLQQGGKILYFDWGDCLELASSDNVVHQNILKNSAAGIYIHDCRDNIISQNIISNTSAYGIRMFRSANIEIVENKITYAQFPGIFIAHCRESELRKNFLADNQGGIYLGYCFNNNIVENAVIDSYRGIILECSYYNTVERNSVIGNSVGLLLGPIYGPRQAGTVDNVIAENNVTDNGYGIQTILSNRNLVLRNNFGNNTNQYYSYLSKNVWDDGIEGNWWSDYAGLDVNKDAIGDTPQILDDDNKDNCPLMGMFSDFEVTPEYHVQTICNSTISDLQYNGTAICFSIFGEDTTAGFCRIRVPTALMNETYHVFVNGTEVSCNLLQCSSSTHSYLYFSYTHSTQEVIVVPESSAFAMWFFALLSLLALIIDGSYRKSVKICRSKAGKH